MHDTSFQPVVKGVTIAALAIGLDMETFPVHPLLRGDVVRDDLHGNALSPTRKFAGLKELVQQMPLQLLGGSQLSLGTHVNSNFVEVNGEVVVDQELLKDRRRPVSQVEVEPCSSLGPNTWATFLRSWAIVSTMGSLSATLS